MVSRPDRAASDACAEVRHEGTNMPTPNRLDGRRAWPVILAALLLPALFALPAVAQPDRGDLQAHDAVTEQATATVSSLDTRLIVGYVDGAEERLDTAMAQTQADDAADIVQAEAEIVTRTAGDAAVVQLDRRLTPEQVDAYAADLEADPAVAYVEIDQVLTTQQSDPRTDEQWHYNEPTGGIGLDDALAVSTGAGATVSVIDTGIVSHPDLNSQVVGGYDFISDTFISRDGNGRDDDFSDEGDWNSDASQCRVSDSSWHGSHVAGTVAAVQGNGEGGQGVAPDADIVVARALGRCGGFTSDIAAAIVWSAGGSVTGLPANPNPADVINMSLGGGGSCGSTTQSAIDQARSLGATVVVAAGNSSSDASGFNPANCDGVITVASTNRAGERSFFSNFGSLVELAAPGGGSGGGVLSTIDSGATTPQGPTYAAYQGTSMATPHVAGVAALLIGADAGLTPDEVADAIVSTTRAFPGSCSGCGSGILDSPDALAAVGGGGGPAPTDPPTEPTDPPAADNTFTGPLAIPDQGTAEAPIEVSASGNASATTEVSVDISHSYRGDLRVTIVAPNGSSAVLKSPSGSDGADDVVQTWTVNASSVSAGGTWTLRVDDVFAGDTGTINAWSISP